MLHECPIRLHVICYFDILFCYIDITFCDMAHTCFMRHCIMRYESSILRDAFVSVVYFMPTVAPPREHMLLVDRRIERIEPH